LFGVFVCFGRFFDFSIPSFFFIAFTVVFISVIICGLCVWVQNKKKKKDLECVVMLRSLGQRQFLGF